MKKIAIGGWQHETNTFASKRASYNDFVVADEWPAMGVGEEMLANVKGVHLPINGAIDTLSKYNCDLEPLLWCSATPCSYVTEEAFERIADRFVERLKSVQPIDGIYLDLHGAMVCEHIEDGEGELLRRIRNLVGDALPISISLDLHANVTPLMVENASLIEIFQTYPHIDMGITGARAAEHLYAIINNGVRLYKSFRQVEFLIPLNWGCTLIEPAKSIYEYVINSVDSNTPSISLACGFHLSDIYDVGPAIVAYGITQADADTKVKSINEHINSKRKEFGGKIWPVDEIVSKCIKQLERSAEHQTIVLADTQDNPGGGGSGRTTGVLRALIKHSATNAAFGVLLDEKVVADAFAIGEGNEFDAYFGTFLDDGCFNLRAKVVQLSDGNIIATGPMYKGAHLTLGRSVLLRLNDVLAIVSSHAVQTADQAIFRHFGIEPSAMDIVAVKSSVHFRNDFSDIATDIHIVSSPGEVIADPNLLDYQNIRAGMVSV